MNRMKTVLMTAAMLVCVFACTAVAGKTVYAAPNDTIQTGISADGMDLSGMTQEQAQGGGSELCERTRAGAGAAAGAGWTECIYQPF